MRKLNLVKAIVRYTPSSVNREFVMGTNPKTDPQRYLLLQKAKDELFPEEAGKWEFVGGIIRPKETSRQTITRKMKEDTGLEYIITTQLPAKEIFSRIIKGDSKRIESKDLEIKCSVYLINATGMNITTSSSHSDFRWLKLEDVKNQNLALYNDLLLEFFNNPEEYL